VAAGATTGAGNVTVTNPDAGTGTGTNVFTVNAGPTISTLGRTTGSRGSSYTFNVNGTGFVSGATTTFSNPGITDNSTSFVSATRLSVNITIASGASTGLCNVTVTNPDAGNATKTNAFTVN
jgi:hypothetical protein